MPYSIQVKNLTKIFKAKTTSKNGITALDNVTLSIEKGIIFGLLGPNGAGKTTIFKMIMNENFIRDRFPHEWGSENLR